MPNPAAIVSKLDAVLRRFTPLDRTVFKRVLTRTGDDLIGRISTTFSDTPLNPQPYFNRLGREHVPGGHVQGEAVIDTAGTKLVADDWMFIVSPTAMSPAELQNKDLTLVAKDTAGNEEEFRILDPDTVSISGSDVVYTVYARSIKRP